MTATGDSRFSGDARSIADARSIVRAVLAGYAAELAETAALLTDELATNAVRHGGGRFTLRASIAGQRLRVSVADSAGSAPLTVHRPGHDLDNGRGLTIVEAMASSWGVDRGDTGKSIWFELELPPEDPQPSSAKAGRSRSRLPLNSLETCI